MEKVQFQLESTLPELKDLYEKGLFSKTEIDQITKRRTQFETSLIRRVTRKQDFFKYAEYEINLERLRKIRWRKLNYHINKPPPSASTYSLPRRTLYILKRATAKFPGDLAVWLAYVEYAAREGMTKVVAKGLNSALQHHPLSPTLYLLLSYHHLHPTAELPRSSIPSTSTLDLPSSGRERDEESSSSFSLEGTGPARTTILLGLRLLPRSHTLWREYVKLELGWVEALRRRWRVLGIEAKAREGDESFDGDAAALAGGDGAFGEEGEAARRAILSGQLVVHALKEALDKVPSSTRERDESGAVVDGMKFRQELLAMLRSYPSPLRSKALEVVYADLEAVAAKGGKDGAQARLWLVVRSLYDRKYDPEVRDEGGIVLSGVELVEAYGVIGKQIRAIAKAGSAGDAWAEVAGEWLVERYNDDSGNADLQRFILASIKALTKPAFKAPATLLSAHLELVSDALPDEYYPLVVAYAARYPQSTDIQSRLVAAVTLSDDDASAVRKTCAAAASAVTRSGLSAEEQVDVVSLWKSWAAWEDSQEAPSAAAGWKKLLRDSLRHGTSIPTLHPTLLAEYYASQLAAGTQPNKALDAVSVGYHATPLFYSTSFPVLARLSGVEAHLAKFYGKWRAACRSPSDRVAAVLAWAGWLMEHGKARAAYDAVEVVRREVRPDEDATAEVEAGWKRLADEADRANASEEDGDEIMGETDEEEDGDDDEEEEDDDEEDDEEEDDDEEEGSGSEEGDLDIEM